MITVQNTINASINKVWDFWTLPEHITKWSFASPDWHTPYAENDVKQLMNWLKKFRMREELFFLLQPKVRDGCTALVLPI